MYNMLGSNKIQPSFFFFFFLSEDADTGRKEDILDGHFYFSILYFSSNIE